MTEAQMEFAKYIMGAGMLFAIIAVLLVLAGVFIGGMLVYKTRYAGKSFAAKKEQIDPGDAYQASDDFPLEDDLLASANPLNEPADADGFSEDEESNESKVDKALKNILGRNAMFNQQSNRG